MITTDMPIYTRRGDIVRLSGVSHSNLSRFKTIQVKSPDQMVLVRTASLGNILISKDTRIMGGPLAIDLQLHQKIQVNPNLQFGNRPVPEKLLQFISSLKGKDPSVIWTCTPKIAKDIYKLLDLNILENKVALKYLSELFKGNQKNTVYIKGSGHTELARCIQVLGWKQGLHSNFHIYGGASIVKFKEDCELTEIDYEKNRVRSRVIEVKYVTNYSRRTKFYKISSEELPILPTVAGMFAIN